MNFRFMPAFYRVYDLAMEFQKQEIGKNHSKPNAIFMNTPRPKSKNNFT